MKLNLKQRFDLQKYTGMLYSSLQLRLQIEDFWQELSFTQEEYDKFNIVPNSEHGISYSDEGKDYLIEINDASDVVKNAMRFYIEDNSEANADNELFKTVKETFELVL